MFRYWQVSNDVPKQKGLIKGVLGYETEVKNNSDMGCLGEKIGNGVTSFPGFSSTRPVSRSVGTGSREPKERGW